MKATTLATPGVKKKSEIYYGSPASSSKDSGKTSATVGSSGVTKVSVVFHNPPVLIADKPFRANYCLNPLEIHMLHIQGKKEALVKCEKMLTMVIFRAPIAKPRLTKGTSFAKDAPTKLMVCGNRSG